MTHTKPRLKHCQHKPVARMATEVVAEEDDLVLARRRLLDAVYLVVAVFVTNVEDACRAGLISYKAHCAS